MLLLRDVGLIEYFQKIGKPLPFSLSSLRKDRLDGRLGVPYRLLGGGILYSPADVDLWLSGAPLVVPPRHVASDKSRPALKRGKPTKAESVQAERLGLTIKQFRDVMH
jgi:hypothetical protein